MRGTVYVGTSLHNANRASHIMECLKQENVHITYDWTKHGQVYSEEDLARIAIDEEQGVINCQVFFMIFPGRNGTHIEFGLARGLKKHIVLLEEVEVERKTFYHLPDINRFKTETEAIQHTLQFLDSRNDNAKQT